MDNNGLLGPPRIIVPALKSIPISLPYNISTDSVVATLRVTPDPSTTAIHVSWRDGRTFRVLLANLPTVTPSAYIQFEGGEVIFREVLPVRNGVIPYWSRVFLSSITGNVLSTQVIDFEIRPRIRISYGPTRWGVTKRLDSSFDLDGLAEVHYNLSLRAGDQHQSRGPYYQRVSNDFIANPPYPWYISEGSEMVIEVDVSSFDLDVSANLALLHAAYNVHFIENDESFFDPFGFNSNDEFLINDVTYLGSLPAPAPDSYKYDISEQVETGGAILVSVYKRVQPVVNLPPVSGTVIA